MQIILLEIVTFGITFQLPTPSSNIGVDWWTAIAIAAYQEPQVASHQTNQHQSSLSSTVELKYF